MLNKYSAFDKTKEINMSKKLAILAAVAAVFLSTASVSFAAPEPLYFQYATGDQG
jgi:hypothetical protein